MMKIKAENTKKIPCKAAEKSFNDLIDGYLKGKPKAELEHHIAHCRHCFGRIEFENKLKEKIQLSAASGKSKSLRKKITFLLENEKTETEK